MRTVTDPRPLGSARLAHRHVYQKLGDEATEHLDIMNKTGDLPWELSFSYGRALQAPALDAWQGQEDNFAAGQAALFKRAKFNSLAHAGSFDTAMECATG
ncbi:MAG: fructose-bisphosphate aldolase [Proteobacteria bacterium]|nr:fructose-bisphosphate aldolase [Pseudomonadota bacterium]